MVYCNGKVMELREFLDQVASRDSTMDGACTAQTSSVETKHRRVH